MPRKDKRLMDEAYEQIRDRVITLAYSPAERLDDVRVSTDLGIGRTPVREALIRLTAEGLIQISGTAGFVVRGMDIADLRALFEAHVVLMKAIARLTANRASAADVQTMKTAAREVERAIEGQDYLGVTKANADLHRAESRASHSHHLEQMASAVHAQSQRLAYLCFGGGGAQWGGLTEHFRMVRFQHDGLISCYEAADADGAEKLAMAHVDLFRHRVQAHLTSDALASLVYTDADFAAIRPLIPVESEPTRMSWHPQHGFVTRSREDHEPTMSRDG